MITICSGCGLYRSEEEPTPCPDCNPVSVKQAKCGNGNCDRPAAVVMHPVGYVFCSPCYEGFVLGQDYPDETIGVDDRRRE